VANDLPTRSWEHAFGDPTWAAQRVADVAVASAPEARATRGPTSVEAPTNVATSATAHVSAAQDVAAIEGGSIRDINKVGGKTNCANCAIATDSTLAGSPASALDSSSTKVRDVSKFYGGKPFVATTGPKGIETIMTQAGPGSRGIVFGYRGPSADGHFFNVVNQGGTVRFLDGQSGKAANLGDGFIDFYLMRTN
jgi:filamentous hemagglutinin